MSQSEIDELRQRLKDAENRIREEQRRREEAEQNLSTERLQTQDTTLPEFLDACHKHLSLGLTIQKDKDSSTKGDPANADRKLRPNRIREWKTFPQEQMAIWEDLMDEDFVTERHFTPLFVLQELGKEVREKMVSSELDLNYFLRQTVELRVASVIKQLHANPRLRRRFCLYGDVTFENHANTLTDETQIAADMSSLSLVEEPPRRHSKRLAAKRSSKADRSASRPGKKGTDRRPRHPRPRADQFCVYNRGPDSKIPAFIMEYKAPHKLSLAHILAGLRDMDLDEVIRYQETESPEHACRRVIAAIITQLVHYMVRGGNPLGLVSTGEAFIFLHLPHNDPSTVEYFLSVPREDVGHSTGWTGYSQSENRLHLTSLGQVLAFTLRALRTPPRDIGWRSWAATQLKTWEMVYDDLLEEIEEKEIPSSDYKPPPSRVNYCRASPVRTRSTSVMATSCHPLRRLPSSDDDAEDQFDPGTPSRRPRVASSTQPQPASRRPAASQRSKQTGSEGQSRQYCTQRCLRGLYQGGPLDRRCPNAREHGGNRHRIDRATLIRLLDQQLAPDDLGPDSKLGCETLHVHGTRGALFKFTLWSHGYTFVGKGVPSEFVSCLKHEASMYSHLTSIHGVFVPVILGSLRLRRPFSYDGIAEMAHLLLMSYAGRTLAKQHEIDQQLLVDQAEKSLQAIHQLGVLHSDPNSGNIAWNEETQQVMFIDFERAKYQNQRIVLESISPNKKRKQETSVGDKTSNKRSNLFERETWRMKRNLQS